jgi:FkbM family methyltransferase
MIQITKHTLLPLIKPYLPDTPVILEAGAFDGKDTLTLSSFWPAGSVHAFEPVPAIFDKLAANVADVPNVQCYQVALSDHTGVAPFHVSEHPKRPGMPFQAGSLLEPYERLTLSPATYPDIIQVPTITIDEWAAQNGIARIDFMWLDMQGHELPVLKAAPRILATTRVVLTEVEFVEAYKGQALYPDVKTWLEGQGFVMIARDFTDEPTHFFGNALFVR